MNCDKDYKTVRANAQHAANEDGYDRGVEYNYVFQTWRYFLLPQAANRFGFELRCEVVSCERIERCQPGHGPMASKP